MDRLRFVDTINSFCLKLVCVLPTMLIKLMCVKFRSETEKLWANQGSVKYISYCACEHETRTDLRFEAKQIQFASELHHDLKETIFAADHKIRPINIHEKLGPEKQVRIIHQSIPAAPYPPPGLSPGNLPFFSYGWQIPGDGGTSAVKCPTVGTKL